MHASPAQIATAQRFTNRLQRNHHDGDLTFSFEMVTPTTAMLSASNTAGLRWFETHAFVLAFIGPRGGLTVKQVEGISAK